MAWNLVLHKKTDDVSLPCLPGMSAIWPGEIKDSLCRRIGNISGEDILRGLGRTWLVVRVLKMTVSCMDMATEISEARDSLHKFIMYLWPYPPSPAPKKFIKIYKSYKN